MSRIENPRYGIGVDTFTKAVHSVWETMNMPPNPPLEVECFRTPVPRDSVVVRAVSPYFKNAEDYVDEAFERNHKIEMAGLNT